MKTRILSGLVMLVVVISAIFLLPSALFNLLLLLLMLGGLYEWQKLCSSGRQAMFTGSAGLLLLYAAYSLVGLSAVLVFVLLALGLLLWLYKTLTLGDPIGAARGFCLADGVASLALAWLAMVVLRDQFGVHQLMVVLLMVWCADSFAYFGGRAFGRTKLAPGISPGKTREGVISGALMAMLVAVVYSHHFVAPLNSLTQMLVLLIVSVLVALVSVVGDLNESKLKRAAGVKDSGNLIPGHGGVLDRIDGLIAGVVIFAFYAVLSRALI